MQFVKVSTDSVNKNEYLVSGFDAPTFSVDNVYGIFESEDKIINEGPIFWVNNNKTI